MATMELMFSSANEFNRDLSSWHGRVLAEATAFRDYPSASHCLCCGGVGWPTGGAARRDVLSVTTMAQMFQGADAFNGDVSGWHGGGLLAEATALRDYTEERLTVCMWWSWVADGGCVCAGTSRA